MPEQVMEKQLISPELLTQLQFYADTPGKDFCGDLDKFIEWLIFSARRHEPWLRFQADLHASNVRAAKAAPGR